MGENKQTEKIFSGRWSLYLWEGNVSLENNTFGFQPATRD